MSKKVITFGKYNNEPLEWLVLKEDDFQALVLCKWCVTSMNLSWNGAWGSTNFRTWLNGTFWNDAFTDDEKKKIVNAYLSDVKTKDNIFLLSEDEVTSLTEHNNGRECGNGTRCNGHNCNNCYSYSKQHGTCWYFRTAYDSSRMKLLGDGNLSYGYTNDTRSIRPAMYVLKEVLKDVE